MMHGPPEVGPRHRNWESGEQSRVTRRGAICGGAHRSGAAGAKGGGQAECEPAKHAPDAEPGKCVTSVGARLQLPMRETDPS
jgi:hypothetical protein